jgi:hypothetical protein
VTLSGVPRHIGAFDLCKASTPRSFLSSTSLCGVLVFCAAVPPSPPYPNALYIWLYMCMYLFRGFCLHVRFPKGKTHGLPGFVGRLMANCPDCPDHWLGQRKWRLGRKTSKTQKNDSNSIG